MKFPGECDILNASDLKFRVMRGEKNMNKGLSITTLALGALITMLGTAIVAISVAGMSHHKMEF